MTVWRPARKEPVGLTAYGSNSAVSWRISAATDQITTPGFAYDAAGNLVQRSGPRFLDNPDQWVGGMENGEKPCRERERRTRRV